MISRFALLLFASFLSYGQDQEFQLAPNDYIVDEIKKLHENPVKFIEMKEAALRDNRPQADLHYLLTLAYMKVGKLELATASVTTGLDTVNSDYQPLLYYRLLLSKARLLEMLGKPVEALRYTKIVYHWAVEQNIVQLQLGCMLTTSIIEWSVGLYYPAIQTLTEAYQLSTEHQTQVPSAHIAGRLGEYHVELGAYREAIRYLNEWLEFATSNGNKILANRALLQLGRAYQKSNNFPSSRHYLFQALGLAEELNDSVVLSQTYLELANLSATLSLYEEVYEYLAKLSVASQGIEELSVQLNIYIASANIYLTLKDFDSAKLMHARAVNIEGAKPTLEQKKLLLEIAAQISFADKDFEQAYLKAKESADLKDKSLKESDKVAMSALRVKFYTYFTELENQRLNKINALQKETIEIKHSQFFLMMGLAFSMLLISILLLVIYIKNRRYSNCLEKSLNTDGLTRLFSRSRIVEYLENYANDCVKYDETKFSVAMLDLDHFKTINDRYGHAVGDDVLKAFALLSLKKLKTVAQLGRLGGEEFLFVFKDRDIEQSKVFLEEFRMRVLKLSSRLKSIPDEHVISVSIGLIEVSGRHTVKSILSCADEALYRAKAQGRNQIVEQKNCPEV